MQEMEMCNENISRNIQIIHSTQEFNFFSCFPDKQNLISVEQRFMLHNPFITKILTILTQSGSKLSANCV